MIKLMGRYDAYAYRMNFPLAATVTTLDEGTWVTLDANGKLVVSNGTAALSFMAMSSKRAGRDNITPHGGECTVLVGPYSVWTDKFNGSASFTSPTTPLKVTTGGILDIWNGNGGDTADKIVGYAIGEPTADGLLNVFIK